MCRLGPVRVVVLYCLFTLVAPHLCRAQEALPVPSPGEAKIWRTLDEKTEFDIAQQPLADVVELIKQRHEIEVQLDARALEDAGLGADTPITRKLHDISLRSALRLMLGELELTYLVRDGFLLITSMTEAENMQVSKVYPVADLVTTKSDFRPPTPGGRRRDSYQELLDTIQTTIAPHTWDDVGGPSVVKAFPNSDGLVVSQMTSVHEEIAELLAALRKTRDKQRAVAAAVVQKPQAAEGAMPEMRVKVYRLTLAPAGLGGLGMMGGGMGGVGGGMGLLNNKDLGAAALPEAPAEQPAAANPPAANQQPDVNQADAAPQPGNNSPKPSTPHGPPAFSPLFDHKQMDAWANEIAQLLPEMIEPESWQPRGNGIARAAAGSIIVRQTDEIQAEIARLLAQIVPFHVARSAGADSSHDALLPPLATPGPQVNWPQEAEPRAAGAEAEIEQALDEPAELDLNEEPLSNVVEMLGQRYGIQAVLDHRALEDAGLGSDTPITRHLRDVTLREALRLMLGELDLTYVIRNEVLLITSKTEAENMLVAKVYPVFDLVVRSDDNGKDRLALDYHSLKSLIQSIVAPDTWDDVGGPGAIHSFANSGALVISQTTEVHEEIARHLRSLRDVAAQGKGE